MRGQSWWWSMLPVVITIAAVAGCTTTGAGGGGTWTLVPLTDTKAVVGRWGGIFEHPGQGRSGDWVEITIREDRAYEVESFRTIGVLRARGTVEVTDGKIMFQGERSTAVGTLYARDGERVLQVDGRTTNGLPVSARLTPAK